MSTLDTAEGVLGLGDRGADRLEDDLDAAGGGGEGGSGGGPGGVGGGSRGWACWDVDEDDEVRGSSHVRPAKARVMFTECSTCLSVSISCHLKP